MSLFSWFTAVGSFVGLVTGMIGLFKSLMDDRPFSYLWAPPECPVLFGSGRPDRFEPPPDS